MQAHSINIRHLRAIAAVSETGTVSAAARAISLSQPAITQALAGIEAQLGIKLFERSISGMVATEAGRILTDRSVRALQLVASTRVTSPQVRALVALDRHGSYAAAAAALDIREPSLHRAVSDLSVSLGQALVERRGRGVAMTARGAALARRFRLAQAELEAAMAELEQLRGREVGRVVIGAMPLSRAKLLPNTIGSFYRLHPEFDVAVIEGSHAELLAPLRDGEIDFMVGALRQSIPADLEQRSLFVDRPVVLGRPEHPLLSGASPPAASLLAGYPWVVPALQTPLRSQWVRMFEQAGIEPPRVAIECGSVLVIRQLLMNDDFLTLLSPAQVAVELAAGWLAKICDVPGESGRTIGVTARIEWRPTRLQEQFLALLEEQAKALESTHA